MNTAGVLCRPNPQVFNLYSLPVASLKLFFVGLTRQVVIGSRKVQESGESAARRKFLRRWSLNPPLSGSSRLLSFLLSMQSRQYSLAFRTRIV